MKVFGCEGFVLQRIRENLITKIRCRSRRVCSKHAVNRDIIICYEVPIYLEVKIKRRNREGKNVKKKMKKLSNI